MPSSSTSSLLLDRGAARLEHAGLTPINWLGAPPEVMHKTLRFIEERYGSVEDYLIHCGYNEARMEALREAMLLDGGPTPAPDDGLSHLRRRNWVM